jgi:hypothetical protein
MVKIGIGSHRDLLSLRSIITDTLCIGDIKIMINLATLFWQSVVHKNFKFLFSFWYLYTLCRINKFLAEHLAVLYILNFKCQTISHTENLRKI